MNWEQVDNYTQRAKVLGGWIVKVSEDVAHNTDYNGFQSGWDWRIAICFLPDQHHSWKLDNDCK